MLRAAELAALLLAHGANPDLKSAIGSARLEATAGGQHGHVNAIMLEILSAGARLVTHYRSTGKASWPILAVRVFSSVEEYTEMTEIYRTRRTPL